ncbi:hypothetical protein DCO58_05155 [Helicobacter saguini]|uniref:Lipoprotein n=1 Tax=Helicobacter saguini TaxID=1548018 RepID=A0A347VHE9_9HELI|nr:hypothetical protein [Helicobacter saguini]MWV62262.1 hypothetical protein [Helicobacter saguini]MWV67065.1 hypothetical protein [Helicobacter saguini]MWV69415.1 hypothetical protein [Helicobacter saguini]MWV71031.1 hypothetical protein [Helicobacter saguini]TLD95063.1 hypothetical protein LS64_003915 [Helicobacter saguini]
MLRIYTKVLNFFLLLLLVTLLAACAKKPTYTLTIDIKEQVETKKPSIPFATNKEESKKWYEQYFEPILKDSKVSKKSQSALEYEEFARLFFADLSQIEYENDLIDTKKLVQPVIFTTFSQDFMREYLFIKKQGLEIAPWQDFSSKINFKENIQSSNFVLQIAEKIDETNDSDKVPNIRTLQNKSYINFNNVVLGNSLLKINDMYYGSDKVLEKSSEITGLKSYQMPRDLQSLLYYRILYFKYNEKFESNYLLDRFSFLYPQDTINALDTILQKKFESENELKSQFRFQNFEPTNPVSIAQCKGGSELYPYKKECIKVIFLSWISYLQKELRGSKYVAPIYIDSRLCLLVSSDKIILYSQNTSNFCGMLYKEKNKEYTQ